MPRDLRLSPEDRPHPDRARAEGRRLRSGRCALLLPFLPLVAACGPSDRDAAAGGLGGPDVPLEPTLADVYTVGAIDGEEWETFGGIASVAFDGEGRLHVLDRESGRVTVLDRNGALVRTFGARGDGPGEFRMPMSMAVLPDGTTAVFDFGHRAFLLFDGEGGFLRSVSVDGEALPGGEIEPAGSGSVLSLATGFTVQRPGAEDEDADPPGAPVRRWDLDGGESVVLARAWRPDERTETRSVSLDGGTFAFVSPPLAAFEPPALLAVLPSGEFALVDSTTWRIRMHAPDGAAVRTVERPIPPRPVGADDRERERERRLAELEETGGPRMQITRRGGGGAATVSQEAVKRMMEERIEEMVFAGEIPVIRDMAADLAGRLWVERTGPAVGEEGPTDVVRADGSYLGTIPADGVRIPDAFGPDGLVAYVERDALDVPVVAVRRLGGLP